MRISAIILGFAYTFVFFACKEDKPKKLENVIAPSARKVHKDFFEHGNHRYDDYFWLYNPKDTAVLALLDAENTYANKMLTHTEGLQNTLFAEITSRQKQHKSELPTKKNGYWVYRRFEENQAYPMICRKKDSWVAPEEIVLNIPDIVKQFKQFKHFELLDVVISPDNNYVAYLADTSGTRRHTLFIKDLKTGHFLPETILNTSSEALQWANDSKNIFYVLVDETVRGYKAMRHTIGTSVNSDKAIYEEKDNSYVVSLSKSRSQQFIFVGSYSNTTNEIHFIDANNADEMPRLVQARKHGLIYDVNHFDGNDFFIQNNDHAQNLKLSLAPLSSPSMDNWRDVIQHSDSSLMENYEVLKSYIIVQDKMKGVSKIRIINRLDKTMSEIDMGDEAYIAEMSIADNDNFDLDSIRFNYQSLSTPPSTFSYNLKSKTKTILQQVTVSGYNIAKYESKRIWIKARDGINIPLSIVYRKDLFLNDGSNPLLLHAYGSYGISSKPTFQSDVISLIDRGFVYCIAHVRGGQELGQQWYEDGKLLKKKNTFNDFVDCAEYLVKERYTTSANLFAEGASAGGMLVAAAINMRPDLFRGIIAELPWTDVVTDMLDESLPLTTLEYDEWGNPKQKKYYDYMLSWSPYDNVKPANYPAVFAFANLNDSQVPFYSPAKWVQKLRVNNTGKNPILFHCDRGTRISSKSNRFEMSRLTALQYAFMLDLLGRSE